MELDGKDQEELVQRLAGWSEAGAVTGEKYFKFLINQAAFDPDLRFAGAAGYIGDAYYNALHLVLWALNIGTNPKDKNAALGSILYPLIRGPIGLEGRVFIAGLIVKYRLLRSDAVRAELQARYQIPAVPAPAGTSQTGPQVDWADDTEQLELQGWFTPEPQLYPMSMIMTAAARARSICRVEVGAINMMGTGILIAPDLVLTNYHVMGASLAADPAALKTNSASTVLRFGAFAETLDADVGQEVRLHAEDAIVASCPRRDFALLRTGGSIADAENVAPFWELGADPAKRDPLYVLQHPEGGPMSLALSSKGVTWIDPEQINIQYTTRTASGSSGSPCFNAKWQLVALHHAGAGSKGEGILMRSIFTQIAGFLHQ